MNNGNPFNQGGAANQYGKPVPASPNRPQKSHKGLIIGISSAVAAVIVATVGVVLFLVLTGVSKKDYQDAKAQTQKVADLIRSDSSYMKKLGNNPLSSYSSLSSSSLLSSSSSSLTISESNIDEYAKNLGDLQSELKSDVSKLSTMKAIERDKDAKEKFDKLQKSADTFDKDLALLKELYSEDGLKPTILASQEITESMGSLTEELGSIEEYEALYTKMATIFRKTGEAANKAKLSDSDIEAKTKALGDKYTKMADLFDRMAKIMKDRDAAAAQTVQSDLSTLSGEMQTAATDFGEAVSDRAKKIDDNSKAVADDVNSLGNYLSSKANK